MVYGVHVAMNRERADRDDDASLELATLLRGWGSRVRPGQGPEGPDLVGDGFAVEVKASPRPTTSDIRALVQQGVSYRGASPVLVADLIGKEQRRVLAENGWGWLDRSGHVRLVVGGVFIDRDIDSLLGPETTVLDPLVRASAVSVAFLLLREPTRRWSVRTLASAAELSVGAVSEARQGMEESGLLDERRAPTTELFWELASRWKPRWYGLRDTPTADLDPLVARILRMELADLDLPGWGEVGASAARGYGAPVFGEEPPRIFLPSQRALTWAMRTWGESRDGAEPTAHVAVPPTVLATRWRTPTSARGWPAASPLAVALELADGRDPRGREILDGWSPPQELQARVW